MICFPNAKINLGLHITEKRADGYHNLETVFYPIPIEDVLEITESHNSPEEGYTFHQSGKIIQGPSQGNLAVKAYSLLKQHYSLPPIHIHLHKNIPSGAGLGGGSSDASFMLKLLNAMFQLQINEEKLEEYAATLGADCAFFIRNKPTYAEGIGNLFSPVTLSLKDYQIVVVKPDIFVSTGEAFSAVKPHRPQHPLHETIKRPIEEWRTFMTNDFEQSVFPKHPEIGTIKQWLYQAGAVYAAMSGSGSSVFGIFKPEQNIVLPDFASLITSQVFVATLK